MRRFVARLIYQKWFYAFLAVVLWFHIWTDVENVIDVNAPRESIALVLSVVAAFLVTVIFLDLHFRWPKKRYQVAEKGSQSPKNRLDQTRNQQLAAVSKCRKRVFPQPASITSLSS